MPFLPPNQQRQSIEGNEQSQAVALFTLSWTARLQSTDNCPTAWAVSPPKIGGYHPHPLSPLLLLLSP